MIAFERNLETDKIDHRATNIFSREKWAKTETELS